MTDPKLDARIRNALQILPAPSEHDTDRALRQVLARRPRRAPSAWIPVVAAVATTAVIVLLAPLLLSGRDAQRDPPVEGPSAGLVEGVWTREVLGAADRSWDGVWQMTLRPDGVVVLAAPAGATDVDDGAAYAVSGGQLRVDAFVNSVCPDLAPGAYVWSRSGERLTLSATSEPCAARRALFAGTWLQAE